MVVLTKKDLRKMEENYYWSGYKSWYPFPKNLRRNSWRSMEKNLSLTAILGRIYKKAAEK
ncbi:hypothetical protein QNH10_10275 [Sporosarcina thermotolerans]|uniref:hypothetical protein n=1 Tax=Sporosarcina thermotolerans TaxID=633404 RepID=UPI0024BC29F6|nr:hypothetical protein [Sporosarcina thermotolerans]WHT49798.1 hypothetical protein QNH10_10275 [Sporosarcina thermotolerans]